MSEKIEHLSHDAYVSLLKKADEWDEEDWEKASKYERHAINAAADLREAKEKLKLLDDALRQIQFVLTTPGMIKGRVELETVLATACQMGVIS